MLEVVVNSGSLLLVGIATVPVDLSDPAMLKVIPIPVEQSHPRRIPQFVYHRRTTLVVADMELDGSFLFLI